MEEPARLAGTEKITIGAVLRRDGCIAEFRIADVGCSVLLSHVFRRWKGKCVVFQKVLFGRT
jgi:hypothetical protein